MANQTHELLSGESRALHVSKLIESKRTPMAEDDHALQELLAAIRRDRERLLRPMVAGGVARLTLPGRI